jgi:putative FmdB family regulatory protein
MPVYEYRCPECGNEDERFLGIRNYNQDVFCYGCGSLMTRLLSGFSFIFEGSEHRDIDCIVGKDAERKWKNIYERKSKRNSKKRNKENLDAG